MRGRSPWQVALVLVGLTALLPREAPAQSVAASASASSEHTPGVPSEWVVDLTALQAAFFQPPPLETVADAFRARLRLGERLIVSDTHLFAPFTVIPYHNDDHVSDARGAPIERGDRVIAEHFPPGEIGIAVKHRRPSRRVTVLPQRSVYALREDLMLHDSHIEMVIGVIRDGQPGAITLSSPQSYERGRFGNVTYPMIFFRPRYPDYLQEAERLAFRDNIRTMMVGFAAVAQLPCNYAGGDPLAASSPPAVREQVAMMLRAISGDEQARAWFGREENLIYCAELALLSTSGGLLVPLNAASVVPLVGEEVWQRVTLELEAHNRGERSRFSALNVNTLVPLVELAQAPPELAPVSSYAPPARRTIDAERLAFKPMTTIDVVEIFVRSHLPAAQLGDETGALRAELLRTIRPLLLELFGLTRLPAADERRVAAGELYDRVVAAVVSAGAGGESLGELLDEARAFAASLGPGATGLLMPPSLFHAVAAGWWEGGLLDLDYVGHGVHFSLVRPAVGDEEGGGGRPVTR